MKSLGLGKSATWLVITALIMISYQLLYTQVYLWEPHIHRIIHLALAFVVVSLTIAAKQRYVSVRIFFFFLIVVVLGTAAELIWVYPASREPLVLPPDGSMIGGTISLVLCLFFTWWRFGAIFPTFFFVVLLYAVFGHHFLPEAIQVPQVSFLRLVSWFSGDIFSESGVYGNILSLLANYIWLFMVYGAFLQASGGLRFIQGVGTWISGRLASGAGMLAVVTSTLVGSVTGSTAANITITGSFTIPMMKERGYSKEQAGAIELAASNGGQILPPIMGAVAFLLANYIGMPYLRVIGFAAVPALLYFACLAVYVQLQAKKGNFKRLDVPVNGKEILLDSPLFIIPFIVLVLLLLQGFSLMYVGFWSIMSIIATGIISHLLRKNKEAKINWKDAKDKLVGGIVGASDVTIIAALLGAIIAIIEMSGLGLKLGVFLVDVSDGNLFLLLVSAAIVCLILGTGVPSLAAYMITATVLAWPIVQLGVTPIAAHLFILVFSVFSHLTPPIGAGLLIASRLAGGNYWGTAREALKAAFIIFFLPFLFVYNPALILQFEGLSSADIVMQFINVIVLIISMSFLFNNYALAKIKVLDRGLFIIAGSTALLFTILPAVGFLGQVILLNVIAVVSCVLGILLNKWRAID